MEDENAKESYLKGMKLGWKKGLAAKKDEATVMKSVLAKFMVPKKPEIKSPYVPPPEQDLFQYIGRSQRQLHQELKESGDPPQPTSHVRKGGGGMRREKRGVGEQLGPPPRSRHVGTPTVQPLTAREYLQAARTTAREKNLARVAEVEAERLEEELSCEKGKNTHLEEQLDHHQEALREFLQYHYQQVSQAISRGEEAKRNLTEQEIRISFFSGLLAEAQTVQEEEEERLQELTAFQQFLAAVSPAQSLRDLKRRMLEIEEEVKVQEQVGKYETIHNQT